MARSSQEVVCEGWLTKSPPTKRIFRARWRKRYFSLTNTGDLPGQYILTYYTDRNCRKLKGTINLDACEQVDLGLKFEERKLKFDHVFDIKTPGRTYYLAAETEEEMRSWVDSICKVCGLKSSDDSVSLSTPSDVEIKEESEDAIIIKNASETPPTSPVSTNPYIPISECITGKSLKGQGFQKLLEYNRKNSFYQNDLSNEAYDTAPHRHYSNYVNELQDPRFYDTPRKLVPAAVAVELAARQHDYKNTSPLQSPTDTESVFTDDDWVHNVSSDLNTSKNTRPSDSSNEMEVAATQKFIKTAVPPRPPKPAHKPPAGAPCYLNLTPTKSIKDPETECKASTGQKIITDDMYDFPRSHIDTLSSQRRHCYTNAAPANVEGTIFRYDLSPNEAGQQDHGMEEEEPASPHSQTSSKSAYSNLPSPLLAENQLMPPPAVNRCLKPKRKLSDSHSICSNQEPPSPRSAPSVDRKLKPPTPLQEAHMRKTFQIEEDNRKIRAAPSPVPNLGRSHESLLRIEEHNNDKMQYLDLDLDAALSDAVKKSKPPKNHESNTVYKQVDFMKTQAFNLTRNNLEKERQEPFKK